MSILEMSKDHGYIRNATLCYVQLQKADRPHQLKKGSTTLYQYSIDMVVDEDTYDGWSEAFPQNRKDFIKTELFEAKYKCAPPYPAEKKQYILKLKADAQWGKDIFDQTDKEKLKYRMGDYIPYTFGNRPKLYVPVEGGVEDITASILVSSGSIGDVRFNIKKNGKFPDSPQMTGVLVTTLIEYVMESSNDTGFGAIVGESVAPTFEAPQQAGTATKEPEEEPKEESSGGADPFDDDIPFAPIGLAHDMLYNCI